MAGAGFKTFNTGDVLTASDVNTYLMQQTVMVFTDASARSTALGANVAEGMISYLKDTNAVERYDGSSWGAIGAGDIEGVTAGAGLSGGGTSGTVTLNLNSLSAGRNAVINGGFDIWQRGTSIVAGTKTYNADRWITGRSAWAAGATTSRQTTSDTTNLPNIQYAARVQRDSGNTGTGVIFFNTTFENVNSTPFIGQTINLSFYARRGANYSSASNALIARVYSGTGTDQNVNDGLTGSATPVSGTATLTTTWQRFSYSGTVSASATQLAIEFQFTPVGTAGANDWFEVTGVQLELGSSATPFSRAGGTIQGELAACQRYYYRVTPSVTYGKYGGYAYSTSTTNVDFSFTPKVTMRVQPTSVDFSQIQLVDTTTNSSTGTASAIGIDGSGASGEMINAYISTTGATAGRSMIVRNNNNTAGYIGFSAEL